MYHTSLLENYNFPHVCQFYIKLRSREYYMINLNIKRLLTRSSTPKTLQSLYFTSKHKKMPLKELYLNMLNFALITNK